MRTKDLDVHSKTASDASDIIDTTSGPDAPDVEFVNMSVAILDPAIKVPSSDTYGPSIVSGSYVINIRMLTARMISSSAFSYGRSLMAVSIFPRLLHLTTQSATLTTSHTQMT